MTEHARRWWLSQANGWGKTLRGATAPSTEPRGSVRPGKEISLQSSAGGPLHPGGSPASVGGLALPINMHATDGQLLLASRRRGQVLRYDPATRRFRGWIGLQPLGLGPRGPAIVLTAIEDALVVAEREGRQLFALNTAVPLVVDSASLSRSVVLDARPMGRGSLAILARAANGTAQLWRWRPGAEGPTRVTDVPDSASTSPVRILVGTSGSLYAYEDSGHQVISLPPAADDEWIPVADVADDFAGLPVVIERHDVSSWRVRVPPPDAPRPFAWPAPAPWPAFDSDGRALELEPDAPVGPPPYVASGTIEIGPLDGARPRTTWDRLELEIGALPKGTALEVSTRTSDSSLRPDEKVSRWSSDTTGKARQRITDLPAASNGRVDFSVLSPPGQYLWIRLILVGGAASPRVRSITAVYPRAGIVDYLPLVFRETDQDTRFLERFVGALERTWQPLDDVLDDFDRELSAETASSSAMLDYLGSWFDQPMDPEWNTTARRHAVKYAAKYLFQRGTPEAVQAALRLFIANRWGRDPESLGAVPFIWEHFRSRLSGHADAPGGDAASMGRLFGAEILNRLRLRTSRLGEGTLRDIGSPETDAVMLDAHRFSVLVPRALVPGEDDLRGLRNVLAREQPAEAMPEIVLLEPRMRVGLQATLGVDSILGIYPTARLAVNETDAAPGARLNYDCLLADTELGLPSTTPRIGDTAETTWTLT